METTETKVSVIVPVYNCAPYLRQCLDSLIGQEMPVEIIVVDNCSTDGSADIVREYESTHYNIIALYNETNRGQAYSINRGLDAATGEYIAECDADDWTEPDMYGKLYEAATKQDCDVVVCNVIKHMGDATQRYEHAQGKYDMVFSLEAMSDKKARMWFLGRWCNLMSAIYRREFILENNLRYREGGIFEDNSLSFKIRTSAKRYMFIADFLYHYRMDNPTSGTHSSQNVYGICEQFDEIERYAKARGLNLWAEIGSLRFCIYMWALGRLRTDEERTRFLHRCKLDFNRDLFEPELFNSDRDIKIYEKIRW